MFYCKVDYGILTANDLSFLCFFVSFFFSFSSCYLVLFLVFFISCFYLFHDLSVSGFFFT